MHVGIEERMASAGKTIDLPASILSPIPTLKFAEITLTFSRLGRPMGCDLVAIGHLQPDGEVA